MSRISAVVLGVALWFSTPVSAITLPFVVNYVPPSPCTGNVLVGTFGLFEPIRTDFSAVTISSRYPPSPCLGSSVGSLVFDAAAGTEIYLSFDALVEEDFNLATPDPSVFAFPMGTTEGDPLVGAAPVSAPLILIGTALAAGGFLYPSQGPPTLPLFAFSSPGTAIGSIQLQNAAVAEPVTLFLLAGALAGLAAFESRRRPR